MTGRRAHTQRNGWIDWTQTQPCVNMIPPYEQHAWVGRMHVCVHDDSMMDGMADVHGRGGDGSAWWGNSDMVAVVGLGAN